MLKLMLIKNSTHPAKQAGDVLNTLPPDYNFSERELVAFTCLEIDDIDYQEFVDWQKTIAPTYARIFRAPVDISAGQWVPFRQVEKGDAYKYDGVWRVMKKYYERFTMREMSQADRQIVTSKNSTRAQKLAAFSRGFKHMVPLEPDNQVIITGLYA